MGQNNRTRRAAKQRKRTANRSGPTPPRFETGFPFREFEDVDDVELAVVGFSTQARLRAAGAAIEQCIAPLRLMVPAAALAQAADEVARHIVGSLRASGWGPVDLHEMARRRLDPVGSAMLLDVALALADVDGEVRLDDSWRSGLAAVGAERWWDARRPVLVQRAEQLGLDLSTRLAAEVELFAELGGWPVIPSETSGRAPGGANRGSGAEQAMLTKVRALLAKAEATEFPEEADALTAKAQSLMARYALDVALLEQPQAPRSSAAVARVWIDAPYVAVKGSLVDAVATANRCRTVLAEKLGFTTVLGEAGDVRATVLLATSLQIQAARALAAEGSHRSRSGVSRTRSFRHSFLLAYAGRIGERLDAANQSQWNTSAADTSRLLPVLASRSRAVDDAVREHFPNVVERAFQVSNGAGWGAGRAAADLALFDVAHALGETG